MFQKTLKGRGKNLPSSANDIVIFQPLVNRWRLLLKHPPDRLFVDCLLGKTNVDVKEKGTIFLLVIVCRLSLLPVDFREWVWSSCRFCGFTPATTVTQVGRINVFVFRSKIISPHNLSCSSDLVISHVGSHHLQPSWRRDDKNHYLS